MNRLAPALAALPALLLVGAAPAARPAPMETICGWLANPTPGNWWLTDREHQYVIATQGREGVPGWEDVTYDPSAHEYVKTNGNYGYGCACAKMRVDHRAGTILHLASMSARPLAACRNDKKLSRP